MCKNKEEKKSDFNFRAYNITVHHREFIFCSLTTTRQLMSMFSSDKLDNGS